MKVAVATRICIEGLCGGRLAACAKLIAQGGLVPGLRLPDDPTKTYAEMDDWRVEHVGGDTWVTIPLRWAESGEDVEATVVG